MAESSRELGQQQKNMTAIYSLSHLVLNRFTAIGSQCGVTSILKPVASIKVAVWCGIRLQQTFSCASLSFLVLFT